MTVLFQTIGRIATFIMLFVISGCSDSPTDPVTEEPPIDHSGFTASMSGMVNGEVSGDGLITYLPPKERDPVTGIRPGYFLIANLNSERTERRDFVIIFRIPDNAQPGNYNLVAPDPLKVGKNFDVRIEMVEEGKSIFYQTNTEGTINLENFSPNRTNPGISHISGTFQFVTENIEGGRISATGQFDLPMERQAVFQDLVNSI